MNLTNFVALTNGAGLVSIRINQAGREATIVIGPDSALLASKELLDAALAALKEQAEQLPKVNK